MKRTLLATAAICFLAGAQSALAQEKVHIESKVKQTGPGPDVKVKKELTTGSVKEYEAGKKIKVLGPGTRRTRSTSTRTRASWERSRPEREWPSSGRRTPTVRSA